MIESVRVDRYRGQVTAKAKGSKPIVCDCKFAHKQVLAAIDCACLLARAHGLTV